MFGSTGAGGILCSVLSYNSRYFAAGTANSLVLVYDFASIPPTLVRQASLKGKPIDLQFSKDGSSSISVLLLDGTLSVLDFNKGQIIERPQYAAKEDMMFKLVMNMNERFSLNYTHA